MPRDRSLRTTTLDSSLKQQPQQRVVRSPSPTFSDATRASAFQFANGPEKIITRTNLKASLQAYEDLMTTSTTYRAALITMSKVTAAFADAMQACSSLKGPSYEAGTRLQAAAGLHHLIGNHWHVLAETLDKNFEKPLRQHLDTYRTVVHERSASYERVLREKSQVIRQTELSNMNKKGRNLQSFRDALAILQRQVDDLDELKARHYQEIMEHEEEVWSVVQAKICLEVRSTMDVFDRFTAKASDPVIEHMLQSIPDPFDSYGPERPEDQIFSILPPLSILATPSGPASASVGGSPSPSPTPAFYPTSDDDEYGSSVAASSSPPGLGGVSNLYSYPGNGGHTTTTMGDSSAMRRSWTTPTPSFTGGSAAVFFDGANAEWATAPSSLGSTSSSSGAMSPPPPSSRTMSTPSISGNGAGGGAKKLNGATATGGLPRRASVGAESKLRSVLAVDEDNNKNTNGTGSNSESDSSSAEVSTIRANGDSGNNDGNGDDDHRSTSDNNSSAASTTTRTPTNATPSYAGGTGSSWWANMTYGESPYSGLSFLSPAASSGARGGETEDSDSTPRTSRHLSDDVVINMNGGGVGHLRSGSGSSGSRRRQRSGSLHSDDTAQAPLEVS